MTLRCGTQTLPLIGVQDRLWPWPAFLLPPDGRDQRRFPRHRQRKLEDDSKRFRVTVSLLNPQMECLMQAMAASFGKTEDSMRNEVIDGLEKLLKLRSELSRSAAERFSIRVHNAIPFGSAIILDAETNGRIQIETKPYKAVYEASLGFEAIPSLKHGMYDNLVEGYKALVDDGDPDSEPSFQRLIKQAGSTLKQHLRRCMLVRQTSSTSY